MKVTNISIRVRHGSLSESEFRILRRKLEAESIDQARRIFGHGYDFDFDLEEGTLWERIKIVGPLLVFMSAVNTIDDFPSKVVDLTHKVENLYQDVRKTFLRTTNSKSSDVLYDRTRSTDVATLRRIAENLGQLQYGDLSKARRTMIGEEIAVDVARLYRSDGDDGGIQLLLDRLPTPKLPGLPRSPREVVEWAEEQRPRELPEQRKMLAGPERRTAKIRKPRNKYHNRVAL